MSYISPIQINAPINSKNQRRAHHLIDDVFNDYSKVLAVLRNNMRKNQLFDPLITYIAKLEYGTDRPLG